MRAHPKIVSRDTFAAVNGCILAGIATIAVLVQNRDAWRRILLYAALGAATFAVASIPLFIQQTLAHPDAMRRYGIFPVPRTRPLASFACHRRLGEVGLLTAAAFFLLPWIRRNGALGPRPIRLHVLSIGAAVVVSFLALPISCVVLGKAGHVYHFDMFIEVVCSYAVLLVLLIPLGDWRRDETGRPRASRLARRHVAAATAVGAVLLAGTAAVVWQAVRRPPNLPFRWLVPDATGDAARPLDDRYWSDFRDLLCRLDESPELRGAEVLGALDAQVLNWWGAFGPGWQFVAQAWVTPGSDQVQERRLLVFCRLLGLRDEQLPRFLQFYYIKASLLGCAKYQACRGHTFSPLDDYEPADRAEILKKSVDDSWHIVVPKSEIRRLERLYAQSSWRDCEFRLPDVIVLTACERSLGLCPPAPEYAEDFRNSTFTVWVRRAK